jgi:DNA-binding HxlR family transcriptional regulator
MEDTRTTIGAAIERSVRPTAMVRNCSVERTLAILPDSWTFLVLREAYLGARRFEQILAVLGLPRSTLSDRLSRLMTAGVLVRLANASQPTRLEYRLTEKGRDLYLVILSLLRFGDDWLAGQKPPPAELFHAGCGERCVPVSLCSACGGEIEDREVSFRNGPGAGFSPAIEATQRRRTTNEDQLERGRPSSVSRALRIIGDRWSFLVLREAFFGVRRFDSLQDRLGIAPNILADRLSRLVAAHVFERRKYQDLPERFEYRLTAMGHALYLPMVEMLRWGDRWLGQAPPLILTHKTCGQDFHPVISCGHCREPLTTQNVRFKLNYTPPTGGGTSTAQIK